MENSPKRKKRPFYVDATVAQISDDFKSRRAGIVKALTTEVGKFYRKCDPGKENLALFGFPGEKWRVAAPKEVAPSDFPEPVVGINFARDGMRVDDWLSLIAAHSDAWLLANAFYCGTKARFTKAQRKRLFTKINKLPSVLEVLKGAADGKARAKPAVSNQDSNTTILNTKSKGKKYKRALKVKEDRGNGEEESLCGACGERSGWGQFWICCDTCKTWFHGQCVKITSARAEHIKRYKCPVCKSKRARHSYNDFGGPVVNCQN